MKAHSSQNYVTFLCICFLAGLPSFSFSQDFFQNPRVLSSDHGLASNMVYKIAKDHRGFTWIGTADGLCRYDGSSIEVFQPDEQDATSISSGIILDILPDSTADKIWVATAEFLSVYDYKTGAFKNYAHEPGNEFSPPDHHPYCLLKDKRGNFWIGFRDRGLYRYRPETDDFKRELCIPLKDHQDTLVCVSIMSMNPDLFNDSIFWLGSREGLHRFNAVTGTATRFWYTHPDKKVEGFANSIRCLYPHSDGKIYYGVWYEGVFVLDPATGVVSHFNPACTPRDYSFGKGTINSFYPKSEHEFWINSQAGLQLYDSRTDCVKQTWTNDRKKGTWHSVDLIDEAQRCWSAARGLGVFIYNPLEQQFSVMPYESEEVELMCLTRKILEDTLRKKLFVLPQSGRGLYVLDQTSGKWFVVPPPPGYTGGENLGFLGFDMTFLDNGKIFIVEDRRFYLYEPGKPRLRLFHLQSSKANPRLAKVQKDHSGQLWVTGYNWALQKIDLQRNEIYTFDKELREAWKGTLGGDHIEEDINGNLWIRENNGLLIYKRSENKFVYLPYKGGSTAVFRGMSHVEANPEGKDIWIATNQASLGYANADSSEFGILRHFTKEDGLIGNQVYMVKLLGSQLLVFTNEAIQRFDTKAKRFEEHFYLAYGLGGYDESCSLLSSGAIAVGKRKAIALFYPEKLVTNKELPKPYLTSFKVFDKPWKLRAVNGQPDTVFLSHRQNFFSFEFSSIAYNMPRGVRYFYKLEGFDEEWLDGTKRKFAAYTNVPGGTYQFKVKALNNEGLALSEPFVLNLHISKVWYKTWWFWCLAGLIGLGTSILVYRYRIGQVRKEERLKSEYERKLTDVELSALRAQMNPHFIFNSLNSIEYYIINNEPEKASDYLNRFSRLIRLILQNSKSTVVPLKDDLEALRLYIEMESMRFDNLFDYEVKVEKGLDLEQYYIPPMLLQPYVENAIWHGLMQKKEGKGKLDLLLRQQNGHLLCIIEDNGIGREAAQQLKSKSGTSKKSFGMKITGDRLSLLNKISNANASVQVIDLKNEAGEAEGTRVELLIPV